MKKKIIVLCLVVALLAVAAVGGTLAYFTDTDEVTNTFTAGNVHIDLTEQDPADPSKRVDVLEDDVDLVEYGNLFPGMVVTKDPTIENVGSLEAYIAAKVVINKAFAKDLLSGGLLAETEGYELYTVAGEDGSVTLYFFITEPVQPGADPIVLFDALTVPTSWDNAEMAEINGLNIHVEAYATQVYGFTSCFEAINTVFEAEFADTMAQ